MFAAGAPRALPSGRGALGQTLSVLLWARRAPRIDAPCVRALRRSYRNPSAHNLVWWERRQPRRPGFGPCVTRDPSPPPPALFAEVHRPFGGPGEFVETAEGLDFLGQREQRFHFLDGVHQFIERRQPRRVARVVGARHQPAGALRGLPQFAAEGVFVVARKAPHGVLQVHGEVERGFPHGQVTVAGHDRRSLKGSNYCPLRTRRT